MTAETVRRLRGAVRGRPCVPEALELANGASAGALGAVGAQRVGSLLTVGLAGGEHVPASAEDVVGDSDGGLLLATAAGDLAVALGEVALAGAGGGAGALAQRL